MTTILMKENSNTSNFTKNLLEECIHTAVELCMENISRQTSDFCLELAKELAEAAETKAKNIHVPIVFSAVDASGNLLLVHRMNESMQGSIDVSINKAYTANAFQIPTHQLGELAVPGKELYGIQYTNHGRIVLFGGGYPCFRNGRIIGAIGVSGGTVSQDMDIAEYALKIL